MTFKDWWTSVSDPSMPEQPKLEALLERSWDAGFEAGANACTYALAKREKVSRRKMTRRILKAVGAPDPEQEQ